ncbi:MAG: hypothetical protein NC238_06460 [Dehalobacter sp.]|nr:hypothetical protein [Dehalobacter sp.]
MLQGRSQGRAADGSRFIPEDIKARLDRRLVFAITGYFIHNFIFYQRDYIPLVICPKKADVTMMVQ